MIDAVSRVDRSLVAAGLLGTVGIIAALALLLGASYGPDFGEYLAWADAFRRVDLFAINSSTGSPLGLPVSQWSHGPGLLFALGRGLLGGFSPELIVGWLSGVLFWWLAWRIFRELAPARDSLALLGVGLLFVGTPAGFYSMSHASESFSLAPIALLVWLALRRESLRAVDGLWIGTAAATLLLMRSYLLVYALPAVVRMGLEMRRGSLGERARAAGLAAAPGLLAVSQLLFVNRWMTGSPLHSPYVFGDGGFRSVDLVHPEFGAVLWHPLRGLLTYHPLYALGFVATAVLLLRGDERLRRPIAGALLVAVLANLWVQSAWYVWWLGGRTFGMRGMVGAALPLIAGLVALLARCSPLPRAGFAWLGAICGAWSFPFLVYGIPPARAWRDVLLNARASWSALIRDEGPTLMIFAAAVFLLLAWLTWQERRMPAVDAAAAVSVAAAAVHVYRTAGATPTIEAATRALGAMLLLLAFGCLLVLAPVVNELFGGRTKPISPAWNRPEQVAGVVLLIGLVAGALVFARLARGTELRIAAGRLPDVGFQDHAAFHVQEARASYVEYLSIDGFDDKKRALHEFLVSGGFLR